MGGRWAVGCVLCGWYNTSNDGNWTWHAGVVHSTMLRPGHVIVSRGYL